MGAPLSCECCLTSSVWLFYHHLSDRFGLLCIGLLNPLLLTDVLLRVMMVINVCDTIARRISTLIIILNTYHYMYCLQLYAIACNMGDKRVSRKSVTNIDKYTTCDKSIFLCVSQSSLKLSALIRVPYTMLYDKVFK